MMRMANLTNILPLIWLLLLFCGGCGEDDIVEETSTETEQSAQAQKLPDLSNAVEKRIEGKTAEAIKILRKFNSEFPDSHAILIQLARALLEADQFAMSAFRFDQAIAAGASEKALKEAAQAYTLAGDLNSAAERFGDYLLVNDKDFESWAKYGRVLANINQPTKAINALTKGSDHLTYNDCLMMGNLLSSKNLIPQAEFWYKTAHGKEADNPAPLLSLLKIKLTSQKAQESEDLIFQIEKLSPGALEQSALAESSSNLLSQRNLGEFIRRGFAPSELSISQMVEVLNNKESPIPTKPVIARGPKLPPTRPVEEIPDFNERQPDSSASPSAEITPSAMNLAAAFSTPPPEKIIPPVQSHIEKARIAYLDRKYQETLYSARSAIKENPDDAEAWKLCSQAHFQLGETQEAEMTILEAIRHEPTNFDIRMDYLRIARETLSSARYLAELEKARELFPDSSDLVWELARRYHLVERMPVTAGVLYRKVIELESSGSPLSRQAEMELLKLRE